MQTSKCISNINSIFNNTHILNKSAQNIYLNIYIQNATKNATIWELNGHITGLSNKILRALFIMQPFLNVDGMILLSNYHYQLL